MIQSGKAPTNMRKRKENQGKVTQKNVTVMTKKCHGNGTITTSITPMAEAKIGSLRRQKDVTAMKPICHGRDTL